MIDQSFFVQLQVVVVLLHGARATWAPEGVRQQRRQWSKLKQSPTSPGAPQRAEFPGVAVTFVLKSHGQNRDEEQVREARADT